MLVSTNYHNSKIHLTILFNHHIEPYIIQVRYLEWNIFLQINIQTLNLFVYKHKQEMQFYTPFVTVFKNSFLLGHWQYFCVISTLRFLAGPSRVLHYHQRNRRMNGWRNLHVFGQFFHLWIGELAHTCHQT